jgi:glycosyltransferase involved in cell wall biosynthesis
MRGRRILFLNNQGLDQSGGGVTILRHLTRHLARENEVCVLAESRCLDPPGRIEQRVLPPLPPPRGPLWRLDPLRRARAWARMVPALAPESDVVIALDCHFAPALARLRSTASIYLSLSAIPRMEWFLGGRAWRVAQYFHLERRMIGLADLCLVASETHANEIRRFELLPRFNPVVLPPALPLRDLSRRLEPAAIGQEGQVVILSVARLESLKGLLMVPALARRLADLPCVFVILGDGPERAAIEERARALGVEDRVRLLGDTLDPAPFFSSADLFLHPSRYESFGMAVFEAMQYGVPPICGVPKKNTVVAMPEFIEDGRHGRLVDLDDEAGVAEALRDWIEEPDRRREVGRAAAARAEEMLMDDYPRRVEDVVDRLFADPRGGE